MKDQNEYKNSNLNEFDDGYSNSLRTKTESSFYVYLNDSK